MRVIRFLTADSHRVLAVTLVTGVVALAGVTCVGVALTSQQHAPEPSASPAPRFVTATLAPTAASKVVGPVITASVPLTIAIPAIGVVSPLLHLGQTPAGRLEVPPPGPHYNDAGWYRYSPTPGALGPAVIAGHVDSAAEGRSVFYRLGSLRPHDTVLITRTDGSVAVFLVDDVQRFHKTDFPTQFVYGNTDHAALRLITCGGAFDGTSGSYLDNIVVRASLVRATAARHQSGAAVSG